MINSKLKAEIQRRLSDGEFSLKELEEITGIHRSQLSRFRNGKFRRISENLRIVCKKLQINEIFATNDPELVRAVHTVWDGTTKGKKKLVALLKTLENWP